MKEFIVACVQKEIGNPFSHIHIRFMAVSEKKFKDAKSNRSFPNSNSYAAVQNLSLDNQYGHGVYESGDRPEAYGYKVEYSFRYDQMGLFELEPKVKLLKQLQRGIQKIDENEGYSSSYIEYVRRVFRVLKVKGVFVLEDQMVRWLDSVGSGIDEIIKIDNEIVGIELERMKG